MRKIENLVDRKFGRLLVIEYSHVVANKGSKRTRHYWKCLCECGKEKIVRSDSLKNGSIKSCGCLQKEKVSIANTGVRRDLSGQKFGRLTVIKHLERSNRGYIWLCECECGNFHKTNTNSLTSGKVSSCGCYSRELSAARIKEISKRNTGERHYLYNPNLTDEEREDKRDTQKNHDWRKAVYERDNYACRKCGRKTNTLNAHHIENYKDNIDKRYDLNNGITLCSDCHKKFHKKYGVRHTNLKQLKEFLKENTEVS